MHIRIPGNLNGPVDLGLGWNGMWIYHDVIADLLKSPCVRFYPEGKLGTCRDHWMKNTLLHKYTLSIINRSISINFVN